MATYETLATSSLFFGLERPQLEQIVAISSVEKHAPGTSIFTQGSLVPNLYVVQEGTIKLSTDVHLWPKETLLRTAVTNIGAGSAFGWSAVMDPPRATLSAWTIPNTTLVAVDGAGLKQLMDADSTIGYYVMKRLLYLVTSRLMATRDAVTMEQSAEMSRQALLSR